MREVQGPASHDRYAGLEWVPRFFSVFRWAFRKTTSSSDAWVSTFEEQPEEFDLTIHQCLWHDTCVSSGCQEACRFFCECDNYAFGDLKKVGFRRTQTLGTGGDCCDFHFYKKAKSELRVLYYGIGSGAAPGLHDRNMNFNEAILPQASQLLVNVVGKILA